MPPIIKAHAYGNDFLYVEERHVEVPDRADLARAICERHTGIGADGLILYRRTARGAAMQLLNADGSYAEVSGNGVRGLAAVLLDVHGLAPADATVLIETDAGEKALAVLGREGGRTIFRAAMGHPTTPVETTLEVSEESLRVVVLRVGNPQCVRLESPLSEERMNRLGRALERHEAFSEGTNVEFASVEAPGRVRILIWERPSRRRRSAGRAGTFRLSPPAARSGWNGARGGSS